MVVRITFLSSSLFLGFHLPILPSSGQFPIVRCHVSTPTRGGGDRHHLTSGAYARPEIFCHTGIIPLPFISKWVPQRLGCLPCGRPHPHPTIFMCLITATIRSTPGFPGDARLAIGEGSHVESFTDCWDRRCDRRHGPCS